MAPILVQLATVVALCHGNADYHAMSTVRWCCC